MIMRLVLLAGSAACLLGSVYAVHESGGRGRQFDVGCWLLIASSSLFWACALGPLVGAGVFAWMTCVAFVL